MSADLTFSPARLSLARQRRGMTLVQLAGRVGLTAQSLSNAECGRQDPSKGTLEKLADCLGYPLSFFTASDLEEIQDAQVSFRARSKTSARAKSAVKSAARMSVELREYLAERFVLPKPDIPTLETGMDPELAAEHVRARWGVDLVQPIPNLIHLLESRGVAVFSLPPDYRDVDAFSFWWRGEPFVMLSTTKSGERSRFDAAHELGHLVLHKNAEYDRDWRTAEREANKFASALLMPQEGLSRQTLRPVTTDRILCGKRRWRVAAMALAYRLHDLEFLSEWQYRQVVIELGRLGYRTGEPNGIVRETSLLLGKVLGSLREEGVSFNKVAKDLHLTADELREMTFGLVVRSAGSGDPEDQASVAEILGEGPSRLRLVK